MSVSLNRFQIHIVYISAIQHHVVLRASVSRLVLNGSDIRTVGVPEVQHWAPAPTWSHKEAVTDAHHGTRCHRSSKMAHSTTQDTKAPGLIPSSNGKRNRDCVTFSNFEILYEQFSLFILNFFISSSGMFDRQDSLRSDYLSDRETRYGIVQQASIDSTDSRLCYLTSSEVCSNPIQFTCAILRNSSTSVYIKNEKKKS